MLLSSGILLFWAYYRIPSVKRGEIAVLQENLYPECIYFTYDTGPVLKIHFVSDDNAVKAKETKIQLGVNLNPGLDQLSNLELMGLDQRPNTSIIIEEDDIRYYLSTREINDVLINKENIYSSGFNSTKQTVFIFHGWTKDYLDLMPQTVKSGYIASRDFNIILVDWSYISKNNYLTSKYYVPQLGQLIGEFITFMVEEVGLELEKTGFVGHSLGAHLAGTTGYELLGLIDRIIGEYITIDYALIISNKI